MNKKEQHHSNFFAELPKWFHAPGLYKRWLIKRNAQRMGAPISHEDISELYNDIDKRSNYLQLIIKANKAGIKAPETVVADFFKVRKKSDDRLKDLVGTLIDAKKKNISISADEIKELYKKDKPSEKIINALIKANKHETKIKIDDVKTIFYSKKDFGYKMVDFFVSAKKQYATLSATQFKHLLYSNVDLEQFVKVVQLLDKEDLQIPFKILIELLDKRINIIKTITLLSKAKKSCIRELEKHKYFTSKETNRLSNVYVVEGKEKFKKELNKSLIDSVLLVDPVELYFSLTRSDGKGFKVNLEILRDYLKFEYNANINKVTGSYLKARKNKLHIQYDQVAMMAQKEIDVEKFIDAQIKSGADE